MIDIQCRSIAPEQRKAKVLAFVAFFAIVYCTGCAAGKPPTYRVDKPIARAVSIGAKGLSNIKLAGSPGKIADLIVNCSFSGQLNVTSPNAIIEWHVPAVKVEQAERDLFRWLASHSFSRSAAQRGAQTFSTSWGKRVGPAWARRIDTSNLLVAELLVAPMNGLTAVFRVSLSPVPSSGCTK